MTEADYSGGTLSLEQGHPVQQLAQLVTCAQARWISGYFAGLDAGIGRNAEAMMSHAGAVPIRSLTILYETETRNAAELARTLAEACRARGLSPTLSDMSDYKHRQLTDEADVLIIVSTYGEGDPPQPATGFSSSSKAIRRRGWTASGSRSSHRRPRSRAVCMLRHRFKAGLEPFWKGSRICPQLS